MNKITLYVNFDSDLNEVSIGFTIMFIFIFIFFIFYVTTFLGKRL